MIFCCCGYLFSNCVGCEKQTVRKWNWNVPIGEYLLHLHLLCLAVNHTNNRSITLIHTKNTIRRERNIVSYSWTLYFWNFNQWEIMDVGFFTNHSRFLQLACEWFFNVTVRVVDKWFLKKENPISIRQKKYIDKYRNIWDKTSWCTIILTTPFLHSYKIDFLNISIFYCCAKYHFEKLVFESFRAVITLWKKSYIYIHTRLCLIGLACTVGSANNKI